MKLNINPNRSQADPYVFKNENTYFLYTTGIDGVTLYTSKDMYNWAEFGIVFSVPNHKEYWAPSVIKINNKFYMYVSCVQKDSNDPHEQTMLVAEAFSPYGPFIKHNDLIKPFSIDSHVIKSGDDYYIFYSTNDYDAERPGTLIMVDKLLFPYKVENTPVVAVRATLDEEIFQKNRFGDGRNWHTLEGAFYLNKDGYHYLIYSGNCYQNENYYLGFTVAKSNETDLRKITFKKYPNEDVYLPLISKNEFEEGTGHCSVLEEDGKYYLFYHARDYDNKEDFDTRTARIAEISLDKGVIKIIKR